jgi:hypothetical protein
LAVAVCVPLAAANVTVYNNFGPEYDGWGYNWGLGWTIAGENVDEQYGVEQALAFTPSESGSLSDIWMPVWRVPFETNPDIVTIRLVTNPNNLPPQPGDVLEEWTLTEFPGWSDWAAPHHLESLNAPYLEAGQSYWIWAIGGETTWCGWAMNPEPTYTMPHTLRREGQDWLGITNDTGSALRVDVVPEPGSLVLLLAAGALLARKR